MMVSLKMSWSQSQIHHRDEFLTYSLLSSPPSYNSDFQKQIIQPPPPPPPPSGSKISPAILFLIIVLAIIFFISGILHLLVRFVVKHRSPSSSPSESTRYPEILSGSEAFQRQLQQLFHLHDSGLDQAFIDALPVFQFKDIIMGFKKKPFDCAVCLCEFSEQDKLRLLPTCSHAFHIDCIDTWLLSNSTCPLCRGTLFTPGFPIENPVFDLDSRDDEDGFSGNIVSAGGSGASLGNNKPGEDEIIVSEKRVVFSVRLGKYRSTNEVGGGGGGGVERGEGETSNRHLDGRRCYSMGSYQYVVADSDLQVALSRGGGGGSMRFVKGKGGQNGNSSIDGDIEGKKINSRSKGESFSVSKIWQWSRKGKVPSSSEAHVGSSIGIGLPWTDRTQHGV